MEHGCANFACVRWLCWRSYYGDSLEGLEFLIVNTEVTDEHVLLSFTLKRRVQSLRRYAWDMRQLLQELRQNQFGALPKETIQLCKTVESNADSMVSIVEAYMLQCEGVESFYERQQEKVVGSTLPLHAHDCHCDDSASPDANGNVRYANGAPDCY